MLTINDKVYLHIGDLKESINKIGFNKTRLCKVIDMQTGKDTNNKPVGVYTLQAIHDTMIYNVVSNDKLWKMSGVEELEEAIKQSNYDDDTIAAIINTIYFS